MLSLQNNRQNLGGQTSQIDIMSDVFRGHLLIRSDALDRDA